MKDFDGDGESRSLRGVLDVLLAIGALVGAVPLAFRYMAPDTTGDRLVAAVLSVVIALVTLIVLCIGFQKRHRLFAELVAVAIIVLGLGPFRLAGAPASAPQTAGSRTIEPERPVSSVPAHVEGSRSPQAAVVASTPPIASSEPEVAEKAVYRCRSRDGAVTYADVPCVSPDTLDVDSIALERASQSLPGAMRSGLPDLIVSDVRHEGSEFIIELQNQGDGTATGNVKVDLTIDRHTPKISQRKVLEIAAPRKSGDVVELKLELADLELTAADDFSAMFHIEIDVDGRVAESNDSNNRYSRHLQHSPHWKEVLPARADYRRPSGLPDLIVTDIVHDGPYLKVKYRNAAAGASGADFLIRLTVAGESFDGNRYYRFRVPPPEEEQSTGGFTLGLVGVQRGQQITATATIDWEGRVLELNEHNNSFTKSLYVAP